MNNNKESALEKAQRVSEARGEQYGSPLPNMQKIADMWGAYLGVEIGPEDAAVMMQQLKQARLRTGEPSRDEVADIAGYVSVLDRVLEETDEYPLRDTCDENEVMGYDTVSEAKSAARGAEGDE